MGKKREERKHEHIVYALQVEDDYKTAGWEDVFLIHQALPLHDLQEIETRSMLFNKCLELPLVINALTGGAEGLESINRSLACVARETGIGMAVGSQTAGILNKKVSHTFEVVRKENPQGLVMANISALADPLFACEAVEMIEADALQLHLNSAQELIMPEGDRDFRRICENIQETISKVSVPVMLKEVGFGVSRETAESLYKMGASAVDVSGRGGTNFACIESARNPETKLGFLKEWGIPTVASLLEVQSLKLPLTIVSSGGVSNAEHIMKSLAIGASAAGVAGYFLKILICQGESALIKRIEEIKDELKAMMLLTGIKEINDCSKIPLVILGTTAKWCERRGIDMNVYARR